MLDFEQTFVLVSRAQRFIFVETNRTAAALDGQLSETLSKRERKDVLAQSTDAWCSDGLRRFRVCLGASLAVRAICAASERENESLIFTQRKFRLQPDSAADWTQMRVCTELRSESAKDESPGICSRAPTRAVLSIEVKF